MTAVSNGLWSGSGLVWSGLGLGLGLGLVWSGLGRVWSGSGSGSGLVWSGQCIDIAVALSPLLLVDVAL